MEYNGLKRSTTEYNEFSREFQFTSSRNRHKLTILKRKTKPSNKSYIADFDVNRFDKYENFPRRPFPQLSHRFILTAELICAAVVSGEQKHVTFSRNS
jgi:hypothetical protein